MFRTRSLNLLPIILELAVPPLSMLAAFCAAAWCLVVAMALASGQWGPAMGLSLAVGLTAAALGAVWFRDGRQAFPLGSVAAALPAYLSSKAVVYLHFLTHRERRWIRTERSALAVDAPQGTPTPHLGGTDAGNLRRHPEDRATVRRD
jgi:hypothetical protein